MSTIVPLEPRIRYKINLNARRHKPNQFLPIGVLEKKFGAVGFNPTKPAPEWCDNPTCTLKHIKKGSGEVIFKQIKRSLEIQHGKDKVLSYCNSDPNSNDPYTYLEVM